MIIRQIALLEMTSIQGVAEMRDEQTSSQARLAIGATLSITGDDAVTWTLQGEDFHLHGN